jgi:hypothetical protein
MRPDTVSGTAVRTFVTLLFAAACSSKATGPEAFESARTRWVEHGPASYSMVVARQCECLPGAAGPTTVTVRNGIVESRRYVASGADVPAEFATAYPTVPEMFAMIEDATRSGVRPIDVRYAPLGYPTRFVFGDPAVDAPVTFVSDFHSL